MLRTLLIYGLLAGLCGGLLGAGFAKVVGEPPLDAAIAWEGDAQARGKESHAETVSRTVQSTIGLAAGAVVYGVALGGLFALVFAGAYGRISRAGPVRTGTGLAAAAFVVLCLVPFVKYPPNPPGSATPRRSGIAPRSTSGWSRSRCSPRSPRSASGPDSWKRLGGDVATLCAVGTFAVVTTVAALVMPGVSEVPATFPAETLWSFRLASLGVGLVIWTTIGLVFAVAASRAIARSSPRGVHAAARAM